METTNGIYPPQPEIIDIRREELDQPLLQLMLDELEPDQQGVQRLPTLLLYDGRSNFMAPSSWNLWGT
jgi:hypothetical protein